MEGTRKIVSSLMSFVTDSNVGQFYLFHRKTFQNY